MASIGRAFGQMVTYAFSTLDMSSAAGDVVVVRHPDGHFASTPFVVRFGRVKVLRPQDKIVTVEVNGVTTTAVMKMGGDGTAFWVEPVAAAAGGDKSSLVSPLGSPLSMSPILGNSPSAIDDMMPPLPAAVPSSGGPIRSPPSGVVAHAPLPRSPTSGSAHSSTSTPAAAASALGVKSVDASISPLNSPSQTGKGASQFRDPNSTSSVALSDPISLPAPATQPTTMRPLSADDEQELLQARGGEYPQLLESLRIEHGAAATTSDANATRDVGEDADGAYLSAMGGGGGGGLRLSRFASADNVNEIMEAVVGHHLSGTDDAGGADDDDPDGEDDTAEAAHAAAAMEQQQHQRKTIANDLFDGAESNSSDDDEDVEQPVKRGSGGLATSSQRTSSRLGATGTPLYRKTLVPNTFELQKMNLKDGMNLVKFCVGTSLRGRVEVTSRIFLWNWDDVLVISDIDGTVTKSDVLGHIASYFGKDWTHEGLCRLFTNIAANEYKFVYLTARSVMQTEATRRFLEGVVQEGNIRLPPGPVLTAPDKLFEALKQELAKKSYEFKIACLTKLKEAFPSVARPLYAGFGNRIGDVVAYSATGIPKHKIFIINKDSVVHVCEVRQTYKDLAHLVDVTFPALPQRSSSSTILMPPSTAGASAGTTTSAAGGGPMGNTTSQGREAAAVAAANSLPVDVDFNSFNYWRVNPADIIEQQPAATAPASGPSSAVAASGAVSKPAGVAPAAVTAAVAPPASTAAAVVGSPPSATPSKPGWFGGFWRSAPPLPAAAAVGTSTTAGKDTTSGPNADAAAAAST